MDDVPDSFLAHLRAGRWADASWLRDDAWLREHASVPAIREALAIGILNSAGKGDISGSRNFLSNLVGLGDAEYRLPEVRRAGAKRIHALLEQGSFSRAAEINDLVRIDPEYFSQETTLKLIARGLLGRLKTDPTMISSLLRLPVPTEFFRRPDIRAAVKQIQTAAVLDGLPDALAVLRSTDAYDGARENKFMRECAASGIKRAAIRGDDETVRDYAETFGIDPADIDANSVGMGYRSWLEKGELDRAIAFARKFPQLTEAAARGYASASVCKGAEKLMVEGRLEEADRLMGFAHAGSGNRGYILKESAYKLVAAERTDILARVMKRWNVPETMLQEQAAMAIEKTMTEFRTFGVYAGRKDHSEYWSAFRRNDAVALERAIAKQFLSVWEYAKRIRDVARMSREEFEETVLHAREISVSQAFAVDQDHWIPLELAMLEIKAVRGQAIGDEDFSDRMERHSVRALIRRIFLRKEHYHISYVQKEFPFADGEMIRAAAMGAVRHDFNVLSSVNQGLGTLGLEPITWNDDRKLATHRLGMALTQLDALAFQTLSKELRVPPEEYRRLVAESSDTARRSILFSPVFNVKREDLFALYGFAWESFRPADIPFKFLVESEDKKFLEVSRNDPWRAAISPLLRLQARSANEEHDAWANELFPFTRQLVEAGVLRRESSEDANLLVEYVKVFGMLNLPNVARVFVGLSRGPFASLPEGDQALLVELVGPKATRLESANLINEMRKLRFDLQRELLQDRIPHRLGTTLGGEIFHTLRGSTQWEQEDSVADLIEKWKRTVATAKAEGREEQVAVAPGYEETSFAVPRTYRSKDGSASAEQEIQRLWDGSSDASHSLIRAIGTLREPSLSLQNLLGVPGEIDGEALLATMEAFVTDGRSDTDNLLDFSTMHLSAVAPAQWVSHLAIGYFPEVEAELRNRAEFLSQYLLEHYLNPAQNPEHTGHVPFSEPLRLALIKAWQAEKDSTEPGILQTVARIDAIRAKQLLLSKETVDVALVPAQGPLRIFAGDIGDACYSSQHDAMADGGVPGIKAMIFVTNRGKGTERMAGSVLLVETRLAKSDERVIVVRANNPRQNLVAQLDAPSLVRQTIDAAIATAKRRRIKHVGVVLDEATHASSNREAVSAFYAGEYRHNMAAKLVNEPETNFNGYPIWNDEDSNPTVIVWTNDDPEAT